MRQIWRLDVLTIGVRNPWVSEAKRYLLSERRRNSALILLLSIRAPLGEILYAGEIRAGLYIRKGIVCYAEKPH